MARLAAENRCRDVVVLDLREISPVTDFFVVATGTSRRQMQTVLAKVADAIKAEPDVSTPYGTEGVGSDHWALVDMVDVIVHVFAPEARSYYALEMLWGDSPRVDWQDGWQPPAAVRADLEQAP
ncbi:MAG TPA: ribosome silencing factor [Phycisphaerae bacterium]|nr:ribosome silencing factor [Phycisphaerae bacterium]HOI56871.1 ribosome silencing factor [Phycisphaerae bacterium]